MKYLLKVKEAEFLDFVKEQSFWISSILASYLDIQFSDSVTYTNDGATIVSGGAGNLIGQDGAGIAINSAMGGISFGSSYTIQSENTRVVKFGKGSLIIRK